MQQNVIFFFRYFSPRLTTLLTKFGNFVRAENQLKKKNKRFGKTSLYYVTGTWFINIIACKFEVESEVR